MNLNPIEPAKHYHLMVNAFFAFIVLSLLSSIATAQENAVCMECHGKQELKSETGDKKRSLFVDEHRLSVSVHEGFECIDCHMDLDGQEFPHEEAVEPVACAECHEDEEEIYAESLHGLALAKGDPLAPTCAACHGKHDIRRSSDPAAYTTFINIPRLCGSCHKEGAPVQEAREIPHDQVLKNYSQSIHGEGLFKQGLAVTAVCTSCHTAHEVLAHDNPESSIHRNNVVDTCMQCHFLIEEVHQQVINGELWEKEPHKIPVCVDCHSPHEIRNILYEEGMADEECMACHGEPGISKVRDGKTYSLYVDEERAHSSMHGGVACAQCHTGGTPSPTYRPCSTMTKKVDCSICHAEEVEDHENSLHGRLARRRDPDVPMCNDCHEPHYTRGKDQPGSPTFPTNVPKLCGKCHREGVKVHERMKTDQHEIISHYTMSIHGKGLLKSGLLVTAICTDCHTTHGPLPADDPRSSVHRDNVAQTCANCHHGIYEMFTQSIHANGHMKNGHIPPTCSDCHSSHSISRTDVGNFKLGIIERCGRCHEDVTETYFDTFHGKVSKLGEEATAKCYHCHGAHDVLPVSDPRSRLSRENIVSTCQQCHEGAHRRFAGYLTHATHHNRDKYPYLFYAFWGMTLLLIGTLGVAGLHTLFWLWRSLKTQRLRKAYIADMEEEGAKHVLRLSAYQRWLHFIMLLSFFGLAITGMVLKFSYTTWAQVLSDILGGFESTGLVHRICAIVTFGYFGAHLFDLYRTVREKGLKSLLDPATTMLPTLRDLTDLKATWKWFLGKGEYPSYGRWTYWEKFDYFAVFWGVAIIGSTGLMLWFPVLFTYVFPGWFINVATIIHSDEALLAVGFIFTVHFFNTHFRPGKFPMDTVMFTGSMPLAEFKTERKLEYDKLKKAGKLEECFVEPKSKEYLRIIKIFGLSALCLGMLLIALIIYAMVFGYK
ncbi:MAG: cytochrome c3 family protein [Planctomycetota bacterium]|jgi:cytochrome b subunit of formate dehydrogenase